MALALLTDIRLGCKILTGTNTVAYLANLYITLCLALALLTDIRLGWKNLSGTDTVAYLAHS